MASGFHLNVSLDAATAALPEAVKATRKQLDLAADRALKKTAQWLRTHSAREIGKTLGIPNSPLKHRFNVYPTRGRQEVKLWVGIRPLSVHYLGQPKATPTGVKVGKHSYDGAFIDPMRSKAPMVWRRKGKERLPIEKVVKEWGEDSLTIIDRWERRATNRFIEIFEQEARHVLG